MKDDITSLPKWAQNKIQKLEADNDDLRLQIQQVASVENSKITWRYVQDVYGIPSRATVRFALAGGNVDVHLSYGSVEILAYSEDHTHPHLSIFPQSSNSLHLNFTD